MKRIWIAIVMVIGLFTTTAGFGVTIASDLVQSEGSIDYVTASSVSRAQSEVQIRKLKQLLISKKVEVKDQGELDGRDGSAE